MTYFAVYEPLHHQLQVRLPVWNVFLFNNYIAKRRLSAWDTQELPPLAASVKMEIAPMAGKTRQPRHEAPCPQEDKYCTCYTNKQLKVQGGKGGEKLINIPHKIIFSKPLMMSFLCSCYSFMTKRYQWLVLQWTKRGLFLVRPGLSHDPTNKSFSFLWNCGVILVG